MQPYIFPYIGYFQLIQAVDKFTLCDNYQYTRNGWINRNRFLQNGKDEFFTFPLKKDAQTKDIRDRELAPDFNNSKLLNQLKDTYRKSPYFEQTFPLLRTIIHHHDTNLFNFTTNSIKEICNHLQIHTQILKTSDLPVDHSLKKEDRVLALCSALCANVYINSSGGRELYSKARFASRGITLHFLQSNPLIYKQFENPFIPWLSIIDVLMFNSIATIQQYLRFDYKLT